MLWTERCSVVPENRVELDKTQTTVSHVKLTRSSISASMCEQHKHHVLDMLTFHYTFSCSYLHHTIVNQAGRFPPLLLFGLPKILLFSSRLLFSGTSTAQVGSGSGAFNAVL